MCDWNRNEMEGLEEADTFVPDQEQSYRYGGPQGDPDEDPEEDDEAKAKREERERKKAEVRKRLEEAGRAKKAKKGFLTPERKKKLRKLLMMKAAEDLKQQQVLKEQERNKVLQERIIPLPDVDSMSDQAALQALAQKMYDRILEIEAGKFELEYHVKQKDHEINELTIAVNDLRGKFVKPTLKKVSKYDNKFKKMATEGKGDKVDFRENLKKVKKTDTLLEVLKGGGDTKEDRGGPDWAHKGRKPQEGEEPKAAEEAAEVAE